VGDSGTVVRWNGREWSQEQEEGGYDLIGIAASDGDVFALGIRMSDLEPIVLLRWNGVAFESIGVPNELLAAALRTDGESVWVGGLNSLNRWSRTCGQTGDRPPARFS